jgi:hypothetical protein
LFAFLSVPIEKDGNSWKGWLSGNCFQF